ncbi:hypothetical protein A1Q1_00818 [Trichosporon asahii var. asahii CBS 2479]|uniref:Uncharacterized protein n=1 Tax=Trichosporon asahii var. asahii (strain ATCC 90039 / CBS 2479 / JCM 2466 / KCTC 7840 / NBRC 103889/ NCYC 2677 / UAMH 7654) TaxID=1186058 RepID=J6F428_TRIAS|nr:hypothetical protein A1Q1_00818 [Trichosporon asahii var. asahii CBS 2479]EJT49977.1 hypothetical protein A1Q1_00818 [Trichosporon asahii var. asahii CBS 2479]
MSKSGLGDAAQPLNEAFRAPLALRALWWQALALGFGIPGICANGRRGLAYLHRGVDRWLNWEPEPDLGSLGAP